MLKFFPKYFTILAISAYLISVAVVSVLFFNHSMTYLWVLFGITGVICFFYYSNVLTKKWGLCSVNSYIEKLFWTSFVIRFIYIIFSYYFFIEMTGRPFEFGGTLDTLAYHEEGEWLASLIKNKNFDAYLKYIAKRGSYSDIGFPFFLGILNWIFGDSILFARLFNALFDSFSAVLVYKLARRHFGDSTGRMTGIFFMLMPTAIYFSGLHAKESLMVMLMLLYVQRTDLILSSRSISTSNIVIVAITLALLFFFRTILGVVAFLSFVVASVLGSGSFVSFDRKVTISFVILLAFALLIGNSALKEVGTAWQSKSIQQTDNLKNRAEDKEGNPYAKYLTGAVFVPIIIIIPFPTMVEIPGQENQQMVNGGNYTKNIMSFFTLVALILLLRNGLWLEHVFPLAFMIGYLLILCLSSFAHAGRFHMPVIPFLLMFSAYGISNITQKHTLYFKWFLLFEFFAIIFWSWFKLAGRGLV